YVAESLFSRSRVLFRALKKSSERMGLDAISEKFAGHEREKLIALFFGFGRVEGDPSVSRRRLSLAHILDVLRAYERAGMTVEDASLDLQLVYGPTYFGVLASTKGTNRTMSAVPMLEECRSMWRQFCLHEYLTWAIEGLLCVVLDLIDERPGGRSLDEIV